MLRLIGFSLFKIPKDVMYLCFHSKELFSQKNRAQLGLCQDLFFQKKQGKEVHPPDPLLELKGHATVSPSGHIKSPRVWQNGSTI